MSEIKTFSDLNIKVEKGETTREWLDRKWAEIEKRSDDLLQFVDPKDDLRADIVFDALIYLAIELEDQKGIPLETIAKMMFECGMEFYVHPPDGANDRTPDQTLDFIAWVRDMMNLRIDILPSYDAQLELEGMLGKDAEYIRDVRFHGWKPPHQEGDAP